MQTYHCEDPAQLCEQSGFTTPCYSCARYQSGKLPPHYPVPAIIYHVAISPTTWEDAVVIFDDNDNLVWFYEGSSEYSWLD